MIFSKTKLEGALIIKIDKKKDERGFFARTWDSKKFKEFGLNFKFVQNSISFTKKKGTIRGMHYQIAPHTETKIVRCTQGKILDIIIDLRLKSPTFKKWISVELSSKNYKMIYIPKGFAHGFQTLEDNSEVIYQISEFFMPKYAKGIRWNDPMFKIKWPLKPTIISKKDKDYQFFDEKNFLKII